MGNHCSAVQPTASPAIVPVVTIVIIIGEAIADKATEPAMMTTVKVVIMPESLAMAEGKVVMPDSLTVAEVTTPAKMIAPPRVVGVSPRRAIIAAAELPGGAVDGMAAATIVHAARSRVGAAAPHVDSATAL